MRAALYMRVSTNEQNVAMQRTALHDYCKARGFEIVDEFSDTGISGAKESRPALNKLMAAAEAKAFDVVVCYRFDRFARSTAHLLSALETFRGLGIAFASVNEQVDTTTPAGKMIFTVLAAVGELERSIIRERVLSGQKNAKRNGVVFGRKRKQIDVATVVRLRAEGKNPCRHSVGAGHQ